MTGLDTNVLVRFLVGDDPGQAARALELVEASAGVDGAFFLNGVVLCETVWVLDRGYGYARDLIADVLERILLTREFEVEGRDEVWRALGAFRGSGADFADHLIGERNRTAGCDRTVTFDRGLEGAAGFEVV